MITEKCLDTVLPVVADSWEKLRRCDVYRLLDQIHYTGAESIARAAQIIAAKRPDLATEASDCASDLMEERD